MSEESDALIAPEIVEELRQKYRTVAVLEANGKAVVIRKATRIEYKRFRSLAFDPKERNKSGTSLLRDVIVYPDKAEVDAIFDELPGLEDAFAGEAVVLAGGNVEVEVKKY